MSAKTEKTVKTLIGLSAVGVAAYLMYNQLSGKDEETIGGSGAFSGLGGGEGLTEEGISGTSDSGINYNISLPTPDTSAIERIISGGTISPTATDTKTEGGDSFITGGGEITPFVSKKAATTAGNADKAETSGSLSASLAQVFGTTAQRTNERGDYYTTSAGGGAGAVKGKSLGEMFIDKVKSVTSSEGVDAKIYTGATTAYKSPVTAEGIEAVLKTKKEQDAAISQTKIGAYKPVDNPLQALKDSGIVKQSYNPNQQTKKEAVVSGATGSQTTKKSISLTEASKGSSRFSSQGSSKKVIKVKKN
jgi:hypothetical protein